MMLFNLQTTEEQNALSKGGAVETLAAQLDSPLADVQLPALACLANMCYQNQTVSAIVAAATTNNSPDGKLVTTLLGQLMGREKSSLIQLEAARCVAYMHRANALPATDSRVVYRALPCLVRLCHRDRPPRERVAAAETLAYLTEVDTDLQRLASISNHLIPTLAELLRPHPQVKYAGSFLFIFFFFNHERKQYLIIFNCLSGTRCNVIAGHETSGVQGVRVARRQRRGHSQENHRNGESHGASSIWSAGSRWPARQTGGGQMFTLTVA